MPSATISKRVDVSADAIWKLISDFGDTSWMPAGTQATLTGSGVGMERRIAIGPDQSIRERLLWQNRTSGARVLQIAHASSSVRPLKV